MTQIPIKQKNIFLFFIVLFEFSVYVSNDMILPALTTVFSEFNANLKLIPLCLSLFVGGSVLIQLFCGPLSDHFGRRKALFAGGIVTLLGNFLGILSFNLPVFLIGRVFQGMGLCFIVVAAYASVHELFNQKEAVKNIAWMASVALFAPMIGPSMGSFILLFGHWRYIFVFTFSTALIALIGLYYTMPESLPAEKRVPFELQKLIPDYTNLLKNKTFFLYSILNALVLLSLLIWISSSPLLLMEHLKLNSTQFGLIQIPVFAGFIAGSVLLNKKIEFFELKKFLNLGFIFLCVGSVFSFLFSFIQNQFVLMWGVILSMTLFNFGLALFGAPLTRIVLESTKKLKGIASGFNSFIAFGVSTIGLGLISFIPLQNPILFATTLFIPVVVALLLKIFAIK